VEAAFDRQHPSELCLATVDLLVAILASEVGNLALKVLATGAVYWAGGIAPSPRETAAKTAVRADFHQKGPFKDLMERMPIHIITAHAALLGAATFGLQRLSNLNKREEVKASLAPV